MEDTALHTVTVSQVNQYLKDKLAGDEALQALLVRGEVSNFVNHIKSGHFYFTLKDEQSAIKAVMFRMNASRVRFRVENGMQVIAAGRVEVFPRDGVYQLYCDRLMPDGMGALHLAFAQRKEALAAAGLFDPAHKRPIPRMPRRIGVITAKTGAALQDILQILGRRYPLGTVVLLPVLVQGELAAPSIAAALKTAGTLDLDVVIVGRGGGSMEDLWAFNEEIVAHAIYRCPVPVISAVGHDTDFTIADFVADLRAPTPSAAAELCACDLSELYRQLRLSGERLDAGILATLERRSTRLTTLSRRLQSAAPLTRLSQQEGELRQRKKRLLLAIQRKLQTGEESLRRQAAQLEALSPLKVLTRGYTITYQNETILRSATGVKPGDRLVTRLPDGQVTSVAEEIRTEQ